jgi:uncharacterized protein GlcG (DUF336 family)
VDFDIAQSLIAFAADEAAKSGFAVSIVVLDATACPVASARMAGGPSGSVEIAYGRAISAARIPAANAATGPLPSGAASSVKQQDHKRIDGHGGVALRNKAGALIGSLGVAGAGESGDEAIAHAAAASLQI